MSKVEICNLPPLTVLPRKFAYLGPVAFLQSLNGLKRMLSTSHYPVINPSVNNMHTKELFVAGKRDGFLIVGIFESIKYSYKSS